VRALAAALAALALPGCIGEAFAVVRGTVSSGETAEARPVENVRVIAGISPGGFARDPRSAVPSRKDGEYSATFGWGGMGPFGARDPKEVFVEFLADDGASCQVALELPTDVRSSWCGTEPSCLRLDVAFLAAARTAPDGPSCRVVTSATPARVVR